MGSLHHLCIHFGHKWGVAEYCYRDCNRCKVVDYRSGDYSESNKDPGKTWCKEEN